MRKLFVRLLPALVFVACAQGPAAGPAAKKPSEAAPAVVVAAHWDTALCSSETAAQRCLTNDEIAKPDEEGQNFVFQLVKADNVSLLRSLIEQGRVKDLWPEDNQKRTPFYFARSTAMVNLLWAHAPTGKVLYAQDLLGRTALITMAENPDAASATKLVSGWICHQGDNVFSSPLYGLENWVLGNEEINTSDISGHTALVAAIRADNWPAVQTLATCEASKLSFPNQRTVLHYAAVKTDFRLGLWLLTQVSMTAPKNKAKFLDVNARDANGDTALHLASRCKNIEAVHVLKTFGADESLMNARGLTAEQTANEPCVRSL